MTEPQKCPNCAKSIDFGKLAKQHTPASVKIIDGVNAGLIRKDIPALIAEHLSDSTDDNGEGNEFTITLTNLEQTKSISLIFQIEGVAPRESCYYGIFEKGKDKDGETACFIVSPKPLDDFQG